MLGRDGIAGLVCLAGSLGLLALTQGLPQPALVPIGPGFYPRIVLVITAILSAILLAQAVAQGWRGRRAARRGQPGAVAVTAPTMGNARLVVATFVIFTGYVALLPVVGYRIATFLFVLVLQVALEPPRGRGWIRALLLALATSLVTHLAFEGYLSVLLPRGRWTGI